MPKKKPVTPLALFAQEPNAELRAAITAEIEAAFQGVAREDGITLHEADVIDGGGGERARAKARRKDTERRWQDVPDADIEAGSSTLAFLDAKGFRYYLPAFMVWTLTYYRTARSDTVDRTIYSLSPGPEAKDERFKLLNQQQKRAICLFLRYFAEHDDGFADSYQAQMALKWGWDQYCVGFSEYA